MIQPAADAFPLLQVLLDPPGRHVEQREPARGQVDVVLRVAQVAQHGQAQAAHELGQFVGRDGARIDPHADDADIELVRTARLGQRAAGHRGKAVGQPLFRLFGGAQRDSVNYFQYLSQGSPDELTEQCRDAVAKGYECFYLKVGVDAVAEEAMLEAIRDTVGPSARIRIDANEAWSVPEAVRLLTRWHARFDIDFAEAPVRAFPHALMLDLRQRVPVALCANEWLGRQSDALAMIESHAVDVLCFSSYWVGSLRRFHSLSHLAALHGQSVLKHTHGEFGIAAAAGHHMMLALPNVADGVQQTAAMMEDDVVVDRLPISDGPEWGLVEKPGLGIEIDEDKLARYVEAYRRDGQYLPN